MSTPATKQAGDQQQAENPSLSPEQIKHWRDVLLGIIGPYALLMPEKYIQSYRDKMQSTINAQEAR